MKVRLLGCGTSSGVPRIGGDWGTCDPAEPRNRRMRASVLIEHQDTRILVDTGPDMRAQLLEAGVATVDAVIWTHAHADHIFGIDDLRQVFHALGRPVPAFARPETEAALRRQFAYVFEGARGYPPIVDLQPLPDELTISGIRVRVADQPHGSITSAGLRFEADGRAVGYATDIHAMTAATEALYTGLDLWIVDSLRHTPHPSHAHLPLTLSWIEAMRPGRAVLTHMDQSMDYASLRATLPTGVEPGFDGMEVMV